jgi:hypothetical protein
VFIIPSSWGSQLGGYLPASSIFSGAVARGKRRLLQGEFFHAHPLLCFSFALFYFLLASFYQKSVLEKATPRQRLGTLRR